MSKSINVGSRMLDFLLERFAAMGSCPIPCPAEHLCSTDDRAETACAEYLRHVLAEAAYCEDSQEEASVDGTG